jgi:AraC-like DNA-binding protein
VSAQLLVDSLVAVNIAVSMFLWCFISLWVWRSDLSALRQRQSLLLVAVTFPTMMVISLSHASWSFAADSLHWVELVLSFSAGPLFFDFIYGRLKSASSLYWTLPAVAIATMLSLILGNTGLLIFSPALFTLAAFALTLRHKKSINDRVSIHALSVAFTIHLAQVLRLLGRDFEWFEEVVPFTATLLGLAYMIYLLLPRQKSSGKLPADDGDRSVFELVDAYLKRSKSYHDPKLTLSILSHDLDLPAYIVSQAINQHAGRFNDYINQFRIEAFIGRYRREQNVEALAHQVGFNSRSAFYRAFRASTGKTPSQYTFS